MHYTVKTFSLDGISARPVRIEVDIHRALPGFAIVGLPDVAVGEARERVRAALVNRGFEFPLSRIVVNVAAASLGKAGPTMDLAIAVGILGASGQIDGEALSRFSFVGELGLDGSVRPILGALPIAEAACEAGAEAIVVPVESGPEAALAVGVDLVPLTDVGELPVLVAGTRPPAPEPLSLRLDAAHGAPDLADLRGQSLLRRALEVAAAGGHDLLIVGPPGAGKSIAASRLPSILPPLDGDEALEVARIASATGRIGAGSPSGRPFRAPHHTISVAGLIGGGVPLRPGEITLADRGVLFLDELCEFRWDALEALRAPRETGVMTITRGGESHLLPSRFMLVAASNPCPCGRGDDDPRCTCDPGTLGRRARLLGGLSSMFDVVCRAETPSLADLGGGAPGESSAEVADRVVRARVAQDDRLGPGRTNAEMTVEEIRDAGLSTDLQGRPDAGPGLEHRLRVARTLADLDGSDLVTTAHFDEAARLRRWR
ncbi:MAG TPA: YifB family Mg chelatase-like AAA ATPase [Solirubrobacterales bacterium]|jgi:magnesium chelatase family protein|nr:YifB family Mg chelatase-like AAA ATPase [Solirubrobacterales bacterium]